MDVDGPGRAGRGCSLVVDALLFDYKKPKKKGSDACTTAVMIVAYVYGFAVALIDRAPIIALPGTYWSCWVRWVGCW